MPRYESDSWTGRPDPLDRADGLARELVSDVGWKWKFFPLLTRLSKDLVGHGNRDVGAQRQIHGVAGSRIDLDQELVLLDAKRGIEVESTS